MPVLMALCGAFPMLIGLDTIAKRCQDSARPSSVLGVDSNHFDLDRKHIATEEFVNVRNIGKTCPILIGPRKCLIGGDSVWAYTSKEMGRYEIEPTRANSTGSSDQIGRLKLLDDQNLISLH